MKYLAYHFNFGPWGHQKNVICFCGYYIILYKIGQGHIFLDFE